VCRMIVRRAARFGSKIGLNRPFLAQVAEVVIQLYGEFYPELVRNRQAILDSLTREEKRFQRTLESGLAKLENLLDRLDTEKGQVLAGEQAFDLYATYGLPLEITRDIAREHELDVDESGFLAAMDEHRIASGAGETFGEMGGEQVEVYRALLAKLQEEGLIETEAVDYNPYSDLEAEGTLLAILRDGEPVNSAMPGEQVEILLPQTCFYVEAGGQVSDSGTIISDPSISKGWEIRIDEVRKPAAGVIVHIGEVISGEPQVGEKAIAIVDAPRRRDIMRNHTATHLMHAELRSILGEHARQAGSLVAPDRLRFDFTHPEALTQKQLEQIEANVNKHILANYRLNITHKPLQQAMREGAMALFGEKYGEEVRTITIGGAEPFSYELCGGTHVEETGDIGVFLITSEGSAAAGVRRIEAVTGRKAYELIQRRFQALKESAALLATTPDELPHKINATLQQLSNEQKQVAALRSQLAKTEFARHLEEPPIVKGVPVLAIALAEADADTLRQMADRFRQRHPSGVVVLGSVTAGRPVVIAAVTEDLVKRGLHAGELVKYVAAPLGGGGGGKPTLAQAGGKDASKLAEALANVPGWVEEQLRS